MNTLREAIEKIRRISEEDSVANLPAGMPDDTSAKLSDFRQDIVTLINRCDDALILCDGPIDQETQAELVNEIGEARQIAAKLFNVIRRRT